MCSFYKQEIINNSKIKLTTNLKEYSKHNGRNAIIYASNFLNQMQKKFISIQEIRWD